MQGNLNAHKESHKATETFCAEVQPTSFRWQITRIETHPKVDNEAQKRLNTVPDAHDECVSCARAAFYEIHSQRAADLAKRLRRCQHLLHFLFRLEETAIARLRFSG